MNMEQELITIARNLVAIVCVVVVFFALLIGYEPGLSKQAREFKRKQKNYPKCTKR